MWIRGVGSIWDCRVWVGMLGKGHICGSVLCEACVGWGWGINAGVERRVTLLCFASLPQPPGAPQSVAGGWWCKGRFPARSILPQQAGPQPRQPPTLLLPHPATRDLQGMQLYIGGDMVLGNYHAFLTPEGYLVRSWVVFSSSNTACITCSTRILCLLLVLTLGWCGLLAPRNS